VPQLKSRIQLKNSKLVLLWNHLSKRRQNQFWFLLILMLVASLAEVISVGAVLPFLGVLTTPEQLYSHPFMQPLIEMMNLAAPEELLLPLTVMFIAAAIFAGAIRLLLLYVMTRLSFATGADLSINIYRRTLYQEYAVHASRNSSEIINGIITKTNTVINGIISPVLILISSIIFVVAITMALFFIDTAVALIASLSFGALYWIVIQFTRHRLQENSQCIAEQSTQMIKSLQEGLGGIRDVLIDGAQQFYCNLYQTADLPLRKASGNNVFISSSPRFIVEAIGMVLIAGLAYALSQRDNGLIAALPVLGALALGAQRLLPALQQAYGSYSQIKGNRSSLNDVLELLDQPLPKQTDQSLHAPVVFKGQIILKDVSFRYSEKTPWILHEINLTIPKGARMGFIGKTGSGKSTLLDIVMGLLMQTKGVCLVDGSVITEENRRSWQDHIAHVPQNIFLSDGTIEENIAFGIPVEQINRQRVVEAARQAQVAEIIEEWPEKYQTIVGERGIRLSGGQRQRIGIARALYKQADVLIFDEATSALDNETEKAVIESIENLGRDLTILIIAHRLTTLKGCDQVVELKAGEVLIENGVEVLVHGK